jgi:hypothetical protein
MGDNTIGRMAVEVGVDLTDLEAGFQQAVGDASVAGKAVADALSEAVSGNDLGEKIVQDLAPAQEAFTAWQTQIESLVASGSTLAEAMAAVSAPAAAVATEVSAAGEAAQSAAQQLNLFGEAVRVPFAEASGQLNMFTTELEEFGGAAEKAGETEKQFSAGAQAVIDKQHELEHAVHESASVLTEIYDAYKRGEVGAEELARAQRELAEAVSKTAESEHEAESESKEFLEKILEFAGITVSIEALKEFATEAFNLYAAEERAGEGLAFLRGNIGEADKMLDELRETAQDLALPFESVLTAAHQMAYFKLTAEQTTAAITVAADASKASGKSFDLMAASINNIALTGMVMPRTLKQIGISMDDLAEIMEVDASQVTKTFKDMEQGGRLDALVAAMDRTRGATEAMANDTTSNLTRMKNSWEFAMTDMGSAIAPLVVDAIPQLVSAMKYLTSAGVLVVTGLREIINGIVGSTTVVLEAVTGMGKAWYSTITGDFAGAASAAKESLSNIKAATKYTFDTMGNDAAKGFEALNKIWAEQVKTAKEASGEEIAAAAAAAAAAAKAAADRIAAAKELKKELKEVETFAKGIAPALAEAQLSESDYLTQLLVGGKTASAVMKELTQDILKGEAEAAKMSGAPLAAMNAWIVKLKEARAIESDRASMDEEAKAWSKILDQRAAYAAKITAESAKLWEQLDADVAKSQIMQEQGALAHSTRMLEIERASASELAKVHSITLFDELALTQQINDKEVKLEQDSMQRELAILEEKNAADIDYASKREAILLRISALEDKTQGKAAVDAINAQTVAYRALGLESEKALTTQIKEADQALQILKQQGAALGLIYAGTEKDLALRIKKDELTGASATREIVALKNIQIHQQALYDQTHMLGDLYSNVMDDILKGWDQLGKSIADNIIEEQNWGKMFIDVGKQIGKMILEDLVGTYMKALKNSILGITDDTNNLGKSFMSLGSILSKVVGGGGGGKGVEGVVESHSLSGMPGNAENEDGTPYGSGGEGGGAGGAAGSMMSSLGQITSIVSAVAQLINGIIQDFQLAHISKKMGEVEVNTRGSLNQLINIQGTMNEYLPAIKDIHQYLWFTQAPWLTAIELNTFEANDWLSKIVDMLTIVASAIGSGGSTGSRRAGTPMGEGGATISDQLQDLLEAFRTSNILSQYSGGPNNPGDHQAAILESIASTNSSIAESSSNISDYTSAVASASVDGFADTASAAIESGNTVADAVTSSSYTLGNTLTDSGNKIADAIEAAAPTGYKTGAVLTGDASAHELLGRAASAFSDAAKTVESIVPSAGYVNLGPLQSIITPTTSGMQAYNNSLQSGQTPAGSGNSFKLEVKVDTHDEEKIADRLVGALSDRGFKF